MVKKPTELKRGDVIVGIDGHPTPFPIEVTEYVGTIDNGPGNLPTGHVRVKQDPNRGFGPDRYVLAKSVEYGRWVTLAGHRLLKKGDDVYVDPDTGYEVYRDDTHTTWCEDQHPVRITRSMREHYRRLVQEYGQRRARNMVGWDVWNAVENYGQRFYDDRTGKHKTVKGYLCPGGCEHDFSQWIAWDPNDDRAFDGQWADTATEAASYLPAKETV
jgi:hypothetical protein